MQLSALLCLLSLLQLVWVTEAAVTDKPPGPCSYPDLFLVDFELTKIVKIAPDWQMDCFHPVARWLLSPQSYWTFVSRLLEDAEGKMDATVALHF